MIHLYLLGLAAFMLLVNTRTRSQPAKGITYWVMWAAAGISVGIALSSYIDHGGITS